MRQRSDDPGAEVLPDDDDVRAKTAQVREMFDGVAPRYDRVNRIISLRMDRRWRRFCLAQASSEVTDPRRILDVAAGTGDMALALAQRFPDSSVVALDLSAKMLEIAAGRVAGSGLGDRVTPLVGNVEEMPFDVAEFDLATCVFGVRNVEGIERALKEVVRVLAQGGTFVVLETSRPRHAVLRLGHRWYCRFFVPVVGRLFSSNAPAYQYLPRSVARFATPDVLVGLLRDAGFSTVTVHPLSFGIVTAYVGRTPTSSTDGAR